MLAVAGAVASAVADVVAWFMIHDSWPVWLLQFGASSSGSLIFCSLSMHVMLFLYYITMSITKMIIEWMFSLINIDEKPTEIPLNAMAPNMRWTIFSWVFILFQINTNPIDVIIVVACWCWNKKIEIIIVSKQIKSMHNACKCI